MDKTLVACAVCISFVLVSLMAVVSYTSQNNRKAMVEMVAKGADPQAVACAVDGVNNLNQQVCTSLAMQVRQLTVAK